MNIHAHSTPVTLAQCVAMLEARRQLLCEEILSQSQPVAACDADFNALLAERAEVVAALSHLQPFYRGDARIAHPREDH
jgi:hypothetical protein